MYKDNYEAGHFSSFISPHFSWRICGLNPYLTMALQYLLEKTLASRIAQLNFENSASERTHQSINGFGLSVACEPYEAI